MQEVFNKKIKSNLQRLGDLELQLNLVIEAEQKELEKQKEELLIKQQFLENEKILFSSNTVNVSPSNSNKSFASTASSKKRRNFVINILDQMKIK